MAEPIRVLLADDHPLFRAGIAATIAAAEDLEVVDQATTGDEVVAPGRSTLRRRRRVAVPLQEPGDVAP